LLNKNTRVLNAVTDYFLNVTLKEISV